jgi:hypothetical protein
MDDASYSVMMCHVALNHTYTRGEAVSRGQSVGTVGAAGTLGNNGLAHVHFELHRGGQASSPVPFAEPDGLALEGTSLPASSTTAVIAKMAPIVSSNGRGSGAGPTVAKSQSDMQLMSASTSEVQVAAASVPSTARSIPSVPSGATATRKALVTGTDSCLKVHTEPSTGSSVVGCVKDGTEVSIQPLASGADPKWRQTDQGWVSSEYLKRSQSVVSGTNACLNVREAPKASSAKLGCLPDGTAITIAEGPTAADGLSWYRIEPTGTLDKSGWVVGQYLD